MAPASERRALPSWLKVRLPTGPAVARLKEASRSRGLSTVCEEARCPNLGECWGAGTATFMVMGKECTRGCRFCSVGAAARPPRPDPEEPSKLALTLREMAVDYAVLTTVCRDDLPDQGAGHLAACLSAVKRENPELKVEILVQDFRGDARLLERVLDAGPDVVAHNVECVERLTPAVRDVRAGYRQSLRVLSHAKAYRPQAPTKTSLMLGLGETRDEILQAFEDLLSVGVEGLTLGQYLRPADRRRHLRIERFLPPEEFDLLAEAAKSLGFRHVAAGPFVRSSYRADKLFTRGHP